MSLLPDPSLAAFVDLLDGALRARGLSTSLDLDELSMIVLREGEVLPPHQPFPLVRLEHLLVERGVDRRQVEDLQLFLAVRAERIGYSVELPDELSKLADKERADRVAEFARDFAMAQVLGFEKSSNPLWSDETPVVDLLSLPMADPTRRRASLVVMGGNRFGEVFPVEKAQMVIGRASDADVQLDDHGVSRQHAEVLRRGDEIIIRDLSSKNGIFVNGLGVDEYSLEDGDRIQVGSSIILKFMLQDELDERFQERLLESLTTDTKTGAYNRRFFLHRLRVECAYCRRHQAPLALLHVDLDALRDINESHGHLGGDFALAEVVRIFKNALRMEDLVGRYAGEELTVILRGTEGEMASLVADRLRRQVEEHVIEREGDRLPLTISIGVATLKHNERDTPQELLHAAEQALLEAKRNGKNRVCSAP